MLLQPSVLWKLRGQSGTPVTCSIERARTLYHVLLEIGHESRQRDTYIREDDALAHVTFLYRDLVSNGWTETYRREDVVSVVSPLRR